MANGRQQCDVLAGMSWRAVGALRSVIIITLSGPLRSTRSYQLPAPSLRRPRSVTAHFLIPHRSSLIPHSSRALAIINTVVLFGHSMTPHSQLWKSLATPCWSGGHSQGKRNGQFEKKQKPILCSISFSISITLWPSPKKSLSLVGRANKEDSVLKQLWSNQYPPIP